MTSDLEGAKTFYNKAFGWSCMEVNTGASELNGGKYAMLCGPKGPHCGILVPPEGGPKPQWCPYMIVKDVAATVAKCEKQGGTVMINTTDVGMGTMAMVSDPKNGIFGLWKSKDDKRDGDTHELFNWNLLSCPSTAEAWKFYSAVFDNWTKTKMGNLRFSGSKDSVDSSWGSVYSAQELPCDKGSKIDDKTKDLIMNNAAAKGVECSKSGTSAGAECIKSAKCTSTNGCDTTDKTKSETKLECGLSAKDKEQEKNSWLPHIYVDDVDATIVKVREHGGTVLVWPCDIPKGHGTPSGRLAVFKDPQGATLGLFHRVKESTAESKAAEPATLSKVDNAEQDTSSSKLNGKRETSDCPSCDSECATEETSTKKQRKH